MKKIVLLAFLLCAANLVFSSHMRCGYIQVTRESCSSRSVLITITVFTNTASEVVFGEDGRLSYGDGKSDPIAGQASTPRPDLGPNIGMVRIVVPYTYEASGAYLISYIEPNRNGGILNMSNSFYTAFYTETKIDLTTCSSSSAFLAPPIFPGVTDTELRFSLGATSPNNKLITYEMGIPFRDRGVPVYDYELPRDMYLNELTGILSWNTELAAAGEYSFAVVAFEWTKENEQYRKTGFVRIDFQVILEDGEGSLIRLIGDDQEFEEYSRILVTPGEEKTIEITYETGEEGSGDLEMFSELTGESISFGFGEVDPGVYKGILTIAPEASDVREHAYMITIRGSSQSSGNPRTVTDKNYLIYTDEIPEFPFTADPVTGVEEDLAQADIFPNPFQDQVNIQLNRAGKSEAFLFTIHGALVKTTSFESETVLTLSDLLPGVYICDVRRNNVSVKRIKLIKTE